LSEPDRADYQRDLSVSYNKMGDLYRALGQGESARTSYQRALEIIERLSLSEPDRADYQRDLSVSYNKMGQLYLSLGQLEPALEAFERDLEIAERLASAEPDRADYQVDLAISLTKVGGIRGSAGRPYLKSALMILDTLQSDGRLSPADQPTIEWVRKMLTALDGVNPQHE
jgi:tetratricopeptide (TPR) repeat protein